MSLNEKIENLLLKVSLEADINMVIASNGKITYFLGNADESEKYMYSEISDGLKEKIQSVNESSEFFYSEKIMPILNGVDEVYTAQAIYLDTKEDLTIIFFKCNDEFDDKDKFIINSTVNLIKQLENQSE